MESMQRAFLRHKLNPRKFNGVTLCRITDFRSKSNAIETARKLKKTGRIIRVDSFQGEYAVWVSLHKKRVPIPKGRLGLDDSATKYLNWLLPEFWYVIKGNKHTQYVEHGYFVTMIISTPRGSAFYMDIYEHKRYLEIYSVKAEVTGTGEGTVVVNALKKYVDSKRKGMVIRLVKNYQFFGRFKWLKEMPQQYEDSEYQFPDYYYKVNPNTKLRYLWA